MVGAAVPLAAIDEYRSAWAMKTKSGFPVTPDLSRYLKPNFQTIFRSKISGFVPLPRICDMRIRPLFWVEDITHV